MSRRRYVAGAVASLPIWLLAGIWIWGLFQTLEPSSDVNVLLLNHRSGSIIVSLNERDPRYESGACDDAELVVSHEVDGSRLIIDVKGYHVPTSPLFGSCEEASEPGAYTSFEVTALSFTDPAEPRSVVITGVGSEEQVYEVGGGLELVRVDE